MINECCEQARTAAVFLSRVMFSCASFFLAGHVAAVNARSAGFQPSLPGKRMRKPCRAN